MATWLLTWNPSLWEWTSLATEASEVQRTGRLASRWSCGNARRIQPDERFFLLKQGTNPAGVLGSGFVTSSPFQAAHWMGSGLAWYVRIEFDVLFDSPPIRRDKLLRGPRSLRSTVWRSQASGVRVPEPVTVALEQLWAKVSDLPGAFPPDVEVVDNPALPEGGVRRVAVNRYERNVVARKRCLDHHGYSCSVCGVLLSEVYGPVATRLIEVHHLVPLSAIGRDYRVNPVKDLAPICPNCHAVVHRQTPALTLERARKLIRGRRPVGRR